MQTRRPWEAARVKRLSGIKGKKDLSSAATSYLHKTLEGWPECDAGEGRGAGGRWVVCGLCVHVRRGGLGAEGGGAATAAG